MQKSAIEYITNKRGALAALLLLLVVLFCSPFAAAQTQPASPCNTSSIERIWACEEYTWHDSLYTASSYSTSYTYPGANAQGCDSTVTLYLTIVRNSHTIESHTACDSYRWHDSVYTASTDSATYSIRPNSVGCDSITHLHLTIHHADTGYSEMSVCGAWSMHDTTMIRTLTIHGCDSLVLIALNVHAHTYGDRFDTACGSFMWRNEEEYTSDAIIRYRDTNVAGCDSLVTLYLTVNPIIDTDLYDTVCSSKLWNGVRYNGSGIYKYNGLTQHQCDSTARLHLTVYGGSGMTYNLQVCDSILWHGQYYKEAGTYQYNYVNSYGCSSWERLKLNVGARPDSAFHISACNYYNWMGTTYRESGVYLYDYHAHGSDCIITDTLYLTIRHDTRSYDSIDACESYTWRDGQTYTQNVNNVHYYLTNAEGCDSVVYLRLNIHHPGASGTENAMSCDSLLWHGTKLTQSGKYTFDTISSPGCDSTVHLTLTLFRSSHTDQPVTRCDSYRWRNDSLYTVSTNEPTDTLINRFGCDSVLHLNLTINYSGSHTDSANACDSYTWHNHTYTQSGSYDYHGRTTHNCDSLMMLRLHIDRTTTSTDSITVCDSLRWRNGILYTASTIEPSYTLPNAAGCDSVISLRLTVHHSDVGSTQAAVCEQYVWEGDTLTESGIYNIDTLTVYGCDSIKQLNLTIYPVIHRADTAVACNRYTWNNTTYTQSNDYAFIGQTIHGCDSILTLNLTINYPTASVDTLEACDSLIWRDSIRYTASTLEPTHTILNAAGCDSVIHLNLTVHYSHIGQQQAESCEYYQWLGTTYTQSGTYSIDTLTVHGCDSIKQLDLVIYPVTHHADTAAACSSYTWCGTTYTQSNDYTYFGQTSHGCDSILTLHLQIKQPTASVDTLEACDRLVWRNDSVYTASTDTPSVTLVNVEDCDSVITLHLTIHYSQTVQQHVHACEQYFWEDSLYTQSGIYSIDTISVYGCDSSHSLALTIHHATNTPQVLETCDSLTWLDGNTYRHSSGDATYTLHDQFGCDSILHLLLTVFNSSPTDTTSTAACDNYSWRGTDYTQSGSYRHTGINRFGCDSSQVLLLQILQSTAETVQLTACDSLTWINGITYHQSVSSPEMHLVNAAGCDSTVQLQLDIRHSSPLNVVADTVCDSLIWNGALLTLSGSYPYSTLNVEGCDSSVLLQLVVYYNTSTSYTDSVRYDSTYIWHQQAYTIPGTYCYSYTTADGCASVDTLYLMRDHWLPSFRMVGEVNDPNMGYVKVYPDTLLHEGATVYFIAVPHEGYLFLHWSDGSEDPVCSQLVGKDDVHRKAFFIRNLGINSPDGVGLSVLPNPSDGHIQIAVAGAELRNIDVYDLSGRQVYTSPKLQVSNSKAGASNSAIDLSNLPAGNYLLSAETTRGPIVTRIIIATK